MERLNKRLVDLLCPHAAYLADLLDADPRLRDLLAECIIETGRLPSAVEIMDFFLRRIDGLRPLIKELDQLSSAAKEEGFQACVRGFWTEERVKPLKEKEQAEVRQLLAGENPGRPGYAPGQQDFVRAVLQHGNHREYTEMARAFQTFRLPDKEERFAQLVERCRAAILASAIRPQDRERLLAGENEEDPRKRTNPANSWSFFHEPFLRDELVRAALAIGLRWRTDPNVPPETAPAVQQERHWQATAAGWNPNPVVLEEMWKAEPVPGAETALMALDDPNPFHRKAAFQLLVDTFGLDPRQPAAYVTDYRWERCEARFFLYPEMVHGSGRRTLLVERTLADLEPPRLFVFPGGLEQAKAELAYWTLGENLKRGEPLIPAPERVDRNPFRGPERVFARIEAHFALRAAVAEALRAG